MPSKKWVPVKSFPGVEKREIRSYRISGYLNKPQMRAVLGTALVTFDQFLATGLIKPDFYTDNGVFFDEARLEEIKKQWADRLTSSRVSGPVKGVITPFGIMLPQERPNAKLLERLTRSRPKRASRDSSFKTRKRYNLKDLTP